MWEEEDFIQVGEKIYVMLSKQELKDSYTDGFRSWEHQYRVKDENGQILDMTFILYDRIDKDLKTGKYTLLWTVVLAVYSKKKRGFEELKQTGKNGIRSLLIAKEILKWHIEHVIKKSLNKENHVISIGFDDVRRKRVYERGLRDLGFKMQYLTYNKKNAGEYLVAKFVKN